MPQAIPNPTTRFVNPSAPNLPSNDMQVNASTFGILAGQSVEGFGNALEGFGSDMGQIVNSINEQNTQRIAKDADNTYAKRQQVVLYGDGTAQNVGLFNMKGQQALDAIQPTMASLDEMRKNIASTLPNQVAQNLFTSSANERDNYLMPRVLSHINEQRDVANDRSSTDRITQAIADGSQGWSSPAITSSNLVIAQEEARSTSIRHGLDPDATEAAVKDVTGKYWDHVISSAMYQNTQGAQQLFAQHQDELGGIYGTQVNQKLQAKMRDDVLMQERQESYTASELHRSQENNFTQAMVGMMTGKTLLTDVEGMAQKNMIDGQQLLTARALSTQLVKPQGGDPDRALYYVDQIDGNKDTSGNLVAQIFGDHALDDKMKTELMDRASKMETRGGTLAREDVKTATRYIQAQSGSQRGFMAQFDQVANNRVVNAVAEFNDKVSGLPAAQLDDGQTLNKIRDEVALKYSPTGTLNVIGSLPHSQYLPVTALSQDAATMKANVDGARGNLQNDLDAGKISGPDYLNQLNILLQYDKALPGMVHQKRETAR